MSILYSRGLKQFQYPYPHDPDEQKIYTFSYRPRKWKPGIEIVKNEDVLVPTEHTGFMYECVSSGITGITEPAWTTREGIETLDNTVVYNPVPSVCMLKQGDIISSSRWLLSNAPLWGSKVEIEEDEILRPSIVSGYQLLCVQAGVTGTVEPLPVNDEVFDDGTAKFIRSFIGNTANGVIIDDTSTAVKVIASAKKGVLSLTNEIIIDRVSGATETFNRTLLIPILEL